MNTDTAPYGWKPCRCRNSREVGVAALQATSKPYPCSSDLIRVQKALRLPTNGERRPNDRAILHAMSSLTATSKGAATREAILDRAYDIARFAGIEGLSIGPLAQAVGMSKSGVFAHFG